MHLLHEWMNQTIFSIDPLFGMKYEHSFQKRILREFVRANYSKFPNLAPGKQFSSNIRVSLIRYISSVSPDYNTRTPCFSKKNIPAPNFSNYNILHHSSTTVISHPTVI